MFSSIAFRRAVVAAFLASVGTPVFAGGPVRVRTESFKQPPYYIGAPTPAGVRPVLLPVRVVAPEGLPEDWIPIEALERLAEEVEIEVAEILGVAGPVTGVTVDARAVPPAVTFGCALDPVGECDEDSAHNELAVTDGTRSWGDRLAAEIGAGEDVFALSIEVRVVPQRIHQKNLAGKKEIRLGTGHVQPLPWLTSLDGPVWVVQLTGALVGRDGRALRAGAEGVWAVRTPFRASMVGAERLLTDDDVDAVRTSVHRDDLPDRPLAWKVAARRLVEGLVTPRV